MIYKFDSWKPMTADTQSQIDAIFNQVAQYNQQYDTSKPLFFDTETTGGGREDQIIEIAFCDSDRNVIIDTLIYTDRPSSPGAFKVHGIYPHELIGKPTFIDIQPAIVQLLKGRTLYAYNANFDIRMMRQSGHKLPLQQVEVKCLCKQFTDFIGQYSPYFKANRYFSLSNQFSNVVKINTETKQPLSPQQKTDYVNSRPQSLGWYNELKDEVKTLPKERKNDNVPRFRMR